MENNCYGCMMKKSSRPVCEHCGYDERTVSKSHQLPPGTVVGKQYTLGRVLGQGGFGITYIGWDNVMQQRVAVKEYFPSGYAGRDTRTTMEITDFDDSNAHAFEENKKRFLREAESLAKLWDVPQIIRVLRYFEENGTAYIAMEYAEGEDLRRYMKRLGRPMTMEEVLKVLGPTIQALSHVHNAELVHRDISPDNIMVLPDGSSKLLDFGAARYVENANAEQDRNTSTQAILKHGFAPPEQYRSRGALGPWTDIYAMCATVYYCLSGKVPPESMSRMMGEAELNLENLTDLTQQQKNVLETGMALSPKERIKSAAELYQQLFGEILGSARMEAEKHRKEAAQENSQAPQAGKRKKKPIVLVAACAVVFTIAAGILFLKTEKPAEEPEMQSQPVRNPTEARMEALETTQQTIPETTEAVQETLPPWSHNLMAAPVSTGESSWLPTWWEANKNAYAYTSSNGTFSTQGITVPLDVYENVYLPSVPIYNSDIPRSKIAEVSFLDTTADAPEDAWDASAKRNRSVLAWVTPADSGLYKLFIAGEGGINGAQACRNLFRYFTNLRAVHFNGNFHTEEVTDMFYMFSECHKLATLDLSSLDTSNVTNMTMMFQNCVSLTTLDVSALDTSNATDMSFMFDDCTKLTAVDVSHFDTSNVIEMNYMFGNCSSLTNLDVSSWNTSKVTDMGGMFNDCSKLENVDVSNFDTSNVTDMGYMFYRCSGLKVLDVSNWDTSKVTDMSGMFCDCSSMEVLDVSGFDTSNVTDMSYMFQNCSQLTALDISGWNTDRVTSGDNMFKGCSKLKME